VRALDERVVERADRQQPRDEERRRKAECRELQKEVALGDAELDVLAVR
jgi:hypothetical protein